MADRQGKAIDDVIATDDEARAAWAKGVRREHPELSEQEIAAAWLHVLREVHQPAA